MSLRRILAQIWCLPRQKETQPLARNVWLGLLLALALFARAGAVEAAEERVLVALGDSLTAGYGLAREHAFPRQLERALRKRGHRVRVVNAGVSGDTTSAGLARLDWAVPENAQAVIVELGANDALRGQDPEQAFSALDEIIARLKARGLAVLLVGMEAPRNMGADYVKAFEDIYPRLVKKHGVLLYPFFLDGVAGSSELNLEDGLHPKAKGVAAIVERILPHVERLLNGLNKNPV